MYVLQSGRNTEIDTRRIATHCQTQTDTNSHEISYGGLYRVAKGITYYIRGSTWQVAGYKERRKSGIFNAVPLTARPA